MSAALWVVLVPTVRPNTDGKKFFTTKFHKVWDAQVRAISRGLTIMSPSKGQWISAGNKLFVERMIPVQIMCSTDQIAKIARMTCDYYEQEAVMYYRLTDDICVYTHPERKNQS